MQRVHPGCEPEQAAACHENVGQQPEPRRETAPWPGENERKHHADADPREAEIARRLDVCPERRQREACGDVGQADENKQRPAERHAERRESNVQAD